MNPREQIVAAIGVAMEFSLFRAAVAAGASAQPDEPPPLTEAEEARVRKPSVREKRDGPWWSTYTAPERRADE